MATIAKAHNLIPKVSKNVASIHIDHVDQTDESDLNLLSRLATDNDAIVTVKAGHLLLFKSGQATTVSGQPIPTITLTRANGDQHRYNIVEREGGYTGVKAYWNDKQGARRTEVMIGKVGKLKVLRKTYRTEAQAKSAANAELNRTKRNGATFSLTMALGRPDITPETPIKLNGWKVEIDKHSWLVTKATHSLSSGLTTVLDLETFLAAIK
ncbi:MAG: contractile injection system protein, VgrG/Pvc8 family [Agitococcus sp.]|nr:contractile injection system protein, VgrG/Pvc8 family [Agitococcus sp.]